MLESGAEVFDDGRTPWRSKRSSRDRKSDRTSARDSFHGEPDNSEDGHDAREQAEYSDSAHRVWERLARERGGYSARGSHWYWGPDQGHAVWEELFRGTWRARGSGEGGSRAWHNYEHTRSSQPRGNHRRDHEQGSHQQAPPPDALPHLRALGLPTSVIPEQKALRDAFMHAAKKWHPDPHVGDGKKAEAEVKFKNIQAAYQALQDLAG